MVVDQVVGLGGGLLYLDPSDDGARRVAAQLPLASRYRRGWIDMENPVGSIRLNLLSVPPVEGRSNSAASEAAALVSALEDQVPLLDAYLVELGVSSWINREGSNLLLDWACVLLLAHHRARIVGDQQQISQTPAPDLQTLYELLLSQPDVLPNFVTQEEAEWALPAPALAAQLSLAGADGEEARRVAQKTLTAIDDRLDHMGVAYRGLLAASLMNQLRPALYHPSLSRLWRGPFTAPAELLGRNPGPVLLAHLPLRLSGETSVSSSTACWYGSYIVACMVAAARWRLRSGQSSSATPLLLVLQDASVWLTGNMLMRHLDELGRAGISLLATATELPDAEVGAWLLDSTGTWWVHSLNAVDAQVVSKRLRNLGVRADLSLSNLPSGVAVLKFPTQQGPIVATVYTGKSYVREAAKSRSRWASSVANHGNHGDADERSRNDIADLRMVRELEGVEL